MRVGAASAEDKIIENLLRWFRHARLCLEDALVRVVKGWDTGDSEESWKGQRRLGWSLLEMV